MSSSGCQNKDIVRNVPIPGQSNNKTSAVIINDKTTSALKGFNHLSHSKGERVGDAAAFPSLQPPTNFSGSTGRLPKITKNSLHGASPTNRSIENDLHLTGENTIVDSEIKSTTPVAIEKLKALSPQFQPVQENTNIIEKIQSAKAVKNELLSKLQKHSV